VVLSSVARGSMTLPPSKFGERIASFGAAITTGLQPDFGWLSVQALAEHWQETMQTVADAVLHPDLRQEAIADLRKELTSQLVSRSHVDTALAFDTLQKTLYGSHPYGWTPLSDLHAYERTVAADVQRFHEEYWQPQNSALIVVGDVTAHTVRAAVERTFGNWKARKPFTSPALVSPSELPRSAILVIDRPSAQQAAVLAGARVVPRSSSSWNALVVANRILGGAFDSRLNMSLREKKGYSYAIRSALTATRGGGVWYANSTVRLDKLGEAVKEILLQIKGLRLRPPDAPELEAARDACRIGGALELETNGDIAGALTSLIALELPVEDLATRVTQLQQIGVNDITAVAGQQINEQRTSIVVVGPAATVTEQLRKQGLTTMVISSPD
jgi:zinc protease